MSIYIHSLFRAGSTYLFHVFRRSTAGYWCYQEPLHEISFYAIDNRDVLLSENSERMEFLRHPKLGKPYFLELHEVASQCLDKLRKEAIYDSYFSPEGADIGIDFWRALIEAARGRSVIQECRTSSRIKAIKSSLAGFHIYLWRNPWDQWWSYKVADYFDATNQLFINAPRHPQIIDRLRREIGFVGYEDSDLSNQINWFMERRLAPDQSYLIFYVLWYLGLQEGMLNVDLLLNIDRLSDSLEYRQEILEHLSGNSITDLDFSDCSTPQTFYATTDQAFFSRIEDKAHGLLLLSGISQTDINRLLAIRHEYEPQIWRSPISKIDPSGLLRDAERARALVVKAEGHEVELRNKFRDEISRQEQRAVAAESRAQEQEQRAVAAEAYAQGQEQRAVAAEAYAGEQEQRVVAAEAYAQGQEQRAVAAEAYAQGQEQRAVAAEAYAGEQEQRVVAAETYAGEQEQRAVAAEAYAQGQEQRAVAAEAYAGEQEQRVVAAETYAGEQEQRAVAAEAYAQGQEQRVVAAEAYAGEQEQRAINAETLVAEFWQRIVDMESRAQEQEQCAVAAQARAQEQEQQAVALEAKITELNASSHHWWQQATAAQQRVAALEHSLSWLITTPFRGVLNILKGSIRLIAAAVRYPIVTTMRAVLARPVLADRLNQRILRYPSLHQRLLVIARRAGLLPGVTQFAPMLPLSAQGSNHSIHDTYSTTTTTTTTIPIQGSEPDLSYLTTHARQIYRELKVAIERQQGQRTN